MEQVPRLKDDDKVKFRAFLNNTEDIKWNGVPVDNFLDKLRELPQDGAGPTVKIKNVSSSRKQRDAVCQSLAPNILYTLSLQGSESAKWLHEYCEREGNFYLQSAGFLEVALHVYLREGL